MSDNTASSAEEMSSVTLDIEQTLYDKVGKWRSKLLDIGNRNPLVSCSFNPSRGVVEIVTPDCESVWRRLAAESEAGADSMRFPWRRELVPPPANSDAANPGLTATRPAKGDLFPDVFVSDPSRSQSAPSTGDSQKIVEWNPSLEKCRASPRLRETDLLTELSDRAIDRRLRTADSYARLAMSEQGVHALYIAFGFLKWFESPSSEDARRSPLILVPVTLSRKTTSSPWELTEAEDDAIDNLCLRQRLRQDFSLELPPLPDINELEEPGARVAIGAIYRGGQTIVAGDEKQLPPTNFFSRADAELDEEDDIGDFESILSLCKSINMPSKRLRWHYRSKREPLIAFSNRHFYDGDLVTFPSVRDASDDAIRFEHVPEGRWVDRKNIKEAERVADLIINHLRKQPEKSLGVIAFNQSQQRAIEDVIYDRRRNDPRIDAIFSVSLTEPMFIKNLENVQGDERDVILLSMAYGFNDAGKFLKNFGPLTKNGGERRLNVAVTRAKEEIVFVASVRAADLDLSGSTSEGSHLLKAYLEYAEKGVSSLATARSEFSAEAESPFEEEVAAALQRHGLEPVPQVGCGGFRIDMALKHPERPGEFCLGIECDGATYHSSQTARDRDRIRHWHKYGVQPRDHASCIRGTA